MEVPSGFDQIVARFGNPIPFIENKSAWEKKVLATKSLVVPIQYAYADTTISRITAHKDLVDIFVKALHECTKTGLSQNRYKYGGIYNFRGKRGSKKLSTHTWGIAIDLDPANNKMGVIWDGGKRMLHSNIIDIFKGYGFVWGGDWDYPDCMHFQFARKY